MNWLLCIVLTSTKCHHGDSRLLQMLERSASRLGHLKLFPGPWCQIETSTNRSGAGHRENQLGVRVRSRNWVLYVCRSRVRKPPSLISSHSALRCSSIWNKTNKQMAERVLSGVPRLIWNILGECLDSGLWFRECWRWNLYFCQGFWPPRSLTNILYFLFWVPAVAGVMRCEGENH